MRSGASKARSVGAFLPKVTKAALARFGFPAAALLTDWAAIAGAELARFTQPERLRWPRREEGAEEGEAGHGRGAATLVLRAEGPRALEVQHRAPQIIERINAYFGFRAVAEIRIVQAPLAASAPKRPAARRQPVARRPVDVTMIEDAELRAALERLGTFVQDDPRRD